MGEAVGIVVFVSCLYSLMPVVKSKAIRGALLWLAGLAVLYVICVPICRLAEGIRDLPEHIGEMIMPAKEEIQQMEVDSEKWVIRYGVKNIERGIQQMITSRFALPNGTIYVEVDTGMSGDGAVTVEGIRVYMMADAICDDSAVETYVSDMLACPCKVIRGEWLSDE